MPGAVYATAFSKMMRQPKQVFKKFKVDVSLGYAKPESSETDGGVLFAIEPEYAIIDQIAVVGLRMEAAVTAKIDNVGDDKQSKANVSYLLTGDYYFNNNKLFADWVPACSPLLQ